MFVVLFFYRSWLETKIIFKAITHQRRTADADAEAELAKQRLIAEPYQSFLPWACAMWRWQWCCCAVRDPDSVEMAEEMRTFSKVNGKLLNHNDVFEQVCADIKKEALDANGVRQAMKRLHMTTTEHDAILGVQEFGKRERGVLSSEEFSKFYAKLTRRSYIASQWNWVKLCVLFCHGWCVKLLIDTKLARMNDGSLLDLVHPHGSSGWKFTERTWSGNDFNDNNTNPIQEFTEISAVGRDCDWLRYLSSVMVIGQAVLCLEYFVHVDPRLAIITESIRVVADELVHFGLVFAATLMMYALAGHTM